MAVRDNVSYFWADIQQNRPDLLIGSLVATNHQGELSLFEGDYAAGYRGIEHLGAFFSSVYSQPPRSGGTDGTPIDINLAPTHTRQYSMPAASYLLQSGGIRPPRDDYINRPPHPPPPTRPTPPHPQPRE